MIYGSTCTCKKSYIGENRHNIDSWWEEHEDTKKDSESAKHPGHSFTQKGRLSASTGGCIQGFFNHLLCVVPAWSALFEKLFSIKTSKNKC